MGIKIEMEEVLKVMNAAASNLGRIEEFTRPEAERIHALVMDSFRDQRSPDGTPWRPLKQKTISRKGSSKALVDTGAGRASFTSQGTKNSVEFGFGTKYMGYHQSGTESVPARPMLPVEGNAPMLRGPAGEFWNGFAERFLKWLFKNKLDLSE